MARALGLDVQAEGVEETVQETILAELGCDRAQGYLYSRPVPAAELAELAVPGSARAIRRRWSASTRPRDPGLGRGARPRRRVLGLLVGARRSPAAARRVGAGLRVGWARGRGGGEPAVAARPPAVGRGRRVRGQRRGAPVGRPRAPRGVAGCTAASSSSSRSPRSAWAVLAVRRPTPRLLLAGAAASGLVALLWVATRTVGIPLGPAAGEVEAVGVPDVVATLTEVLVVGAVAWALAVPGARGGAPYGPTAAAGR